MVVKKLNTLDLMALHKKQEAALNLANSLQLGQKLNNPLFFLFPYTTEQGENVYDNGGLHITFVKVTDSRNIVSPTICQGVLQISGDDNKLGICDLKERGEIGFDKFKAIVESLLKDLNEFNTKAPKETFDLVKMLSSNPMLLKKSISEFYNEMPKNFTSYIENMPKNKVIENIENEYEKLKGYSDLVPGMGESGCIEFSIVLLLLKYCKLNLNENREAYGGLMINLSDSLGCAFNQMQGLEWSDKVENSIRQYEDVLRYDDFSKIYRYFKECYAKEIQSLEFCNGKMNSIDQFMYYSKFMNYYNGISRFSTIIDGYIKQGIRFDLYIDFEIYN